MKLASLSLIYCHSPVVASLPACGWLETGRYSGSAAKGPRAWRGEGYTGRRRALKVWIVKKGNKYFVTNSGLGLSDTGTFIFSARVFLILVKKFEIPTY
jgi:hypothetical protein